MSFDTEVVKDGRGRAIRVDVSLDGFSTIAYRWGEKAGLLDGTNQYQSRVLELGQVRRGLGQNRIAASSTTSLKLDNADGAMDGVCGADGLATAAAMRFRVYVVLYDPTTSFSPTSKLLGEFTLSSWPERDNTVVTLQLADDFMGRLGPGLQLPNFIDWQGVGNSTNNPIINGIGLPDSLSEYTPIQLAFGEDWLLAHPHVIPAGNNANGETYNEKIIIPLYATTDTSAVSQDLVTQVRVERYSYPPNLDAPNNVPELKEVFRTAWDPVDLASKTVWTVEKSPTIAKAGKNYQVVYLVVRTDLGEFGAVRYTVQDPNNPSAYAAREEQLSAYAYSSGYYQSDVDTADRYYKAQASRVMNWYVKGVPLSQRTNAPVLLPGSHAIDVMTDLVSVYSDATVDATSASRTKAGTPNARAFGVVQAWSERANNNNLYQPPMSLRQVLTNLAQSSDIDIFVDWDGQIAFASDVYDYTTATQGDSLVTFREEEISDVKEWVPSDGERWSAFNRVYLEGGRPNPAEGRGFGAGGYGDTSVPFQGPWDLDDATIPVTTRIIEVGLQQGWRPWRQQREDPIRWRGIDPTSRSRIKFRTHLGGLRLELGDYFKLTWTRGVDIGGPYTSTVFQCETIIYAPGGDSVEIEAVWRDDTVTERQYILDDETLLVRAKNAGDSVLFPTDSSSTVPLFGGGDNFITMGVAAGDILVMRDTTQAEDVFTRNRCMRITAVAGRNITVTGDLDFDFPGGGGIAAGEWSIVRGATTYPTAVSDPTNYPYGGDLYGKVTDASGNYSDTTQGNRLING